MAIRSKSHHIGAEWSALQGEHINELFEILFTDLGGVDTQAGLVSLAMIPSATLGKIIVGTGLTTPPIWSGQVLVTPTLITLGAGWASQITQTATTLYTGGGLTTDIQLGDGRPIGPPVGVIVLAAGGAGNVTGTVQYAYTETGAGGETSLSPAVSIAVVNKIVQVTMPRPRRGVSQRALYRTAAGGSVFKLVRLFDGGDEYFMTTWNDNVLDAALGVTAPTSDSTALRKFQIGPAQFYFLSHPLTAPGPADIGILTSDGETGYSIDAYGPSRWRVTATGTGMTVTCTNPTVGFGAIMVGQYLPAQAGTLPGTVAPTTVYTLGPFGNLALTPRQLGDPTAADGTGSAMTVTATMGATNTATQNLITFLATGAGSAAQVQRALAMTLQAGYTGAAQTFGGYFLNQTASTGVSFGGEGIATGASALSVGVAGFGSGGTKYIGLYGTSASVDPSTLTFLGGVTGIAGAFSNGTNTDDIIGGFSNTTLSFRVKQTGDVDITNTGGTSTTTFKATTGGGIALIRVNGGNTCEFGSTNNITTRLMQNNAIAWTIDTSKNWINTGGGSVTSANLTLTGKATTYNNIATVSGGVPTEYATIDTTGLTANVGATTLYAVPASGAGMYRVSAYVVETTAGSLSSTLPNVQVVYTDNDTGGSITMDATPVLGVAGIGQTGALTANTIGTASSGVIVVNVKASTTIQYQTVNYASNLAGMTYAIHLKLEAL